MGKDTRHFCLHDIYDILAKTHTAIIAILRQEGPKLFTELVPAEFKFFHFHEYKCFTELCF